VLRNRNYFLRFWFRLLTIYSSGSGSIFWQVTVTVPVPYVDHKKQFKTKIWPKNLVFVHSKLFYKEKIEKCHQFVVKWEWKKVKWRKSSTQFYTVLW
jgi:hypothetical protein